MNQKYPAFEGPRNESVHGHLATDGMQVQCHVCGQWYRNVALHASNSHAMSPDEYREEFGLLSSVSLISPDLAERKAAIARRIADENETVQRVLRGEFRAPAGAKRPPLRKLSRKANTDKQRENAATYWQSKLEAQGWSTWHDAVAWANENGLGWAHLERRLGVGGDAMRVQARRAGAEIAVHPNAVLQRGIAAEYWGPILAAEGFTSWQDACDWAAARGKGRAAISKKLGIEDAHRPATRAGATLARRTPEILVLAGEYHRQHGDLNAPSSTELGIRLSKIRPEYQPGSTRPLQIELGKLDPDWHLTPTARRALARGEAAPPKPQPWPDRLRGQGWDSWVDAVAWAAANRCGWAEIAHRLNTKVGSIQAHAAKEAAANPDDWESRLMGEHQLLHLIGIGVRLVTEPLVR